VVNNIVDTKNMLILELLTVLMRRVGREELLDGGSGLLPVGPGEGHKGVEMLTLEDLVVMQGSEERAVEVPVVL
jgi:hypothetical protein